MAGRDGALDGAFVYAVTTTGVYCRPGCASRTPRRENVRFFETSASAGDAGFRACKRCRPELEQVFDAGREGVIALCRALEVDDVDVKDFASRLGYSERHLRRRFRELTGVTIGAYARQHRARRARAELAASHAVAASLYDAGYGSSRAFYEQAAVQLAMNPRRYRAGGAGEEIAFTTFPTALGPVLAAATTRGVCAVRLGPDAGALEAELVAEFPRADVARDDGALSDVAQLIAALARGESPSRELPLDLRGTAFQVKVWEALRAIPRGTTRSYAQVAADIGSPRAVRAVGSACGANPVALAVPCHRVLRSDGGLGGYRWGLATKEALLSAEAGDRDD